MASADLEKPFTEEDVWASIQSCDGNRAPGPDGFNLSFYNEFWGLIKEDIMKVFNDFHGHGKLVKGIHRSHSKVY